MSDRLNELLVKRAKESGSEALIAKSSKLSHTLSRLRSAATMDAVVRAMDTQTDGEGAEWVNAGFSPDVIQQVSLDRKVSSLFERVTMYNNPYTYPVDGADPIAYITPENISDVDAERTSVKFSTPGTGDMTFNAKKMSVAVRTSDEFQQDAIVDVEQAVNRKVLRGLINGEENALINGSTAGTHMDVDTTDSDDPRRGVQGLRARAIAAGATVDFATISGSDSTVLTAIRRVRAKMGAFGASPSRLTTIASTTGHIHLTEEKAVQTLDKFGPQATVLTGEVGKVDGAPLVLSEYMREDLNATGVFDGVTTNTTSLLIVHRGGAAIGDRLQVQLEAEREAKYGQDVVIGRQRWDFQGWYDDDVTFVGMVYNIPLFG